MPRHPQVHTEGLLYHVMARGNDGQRIFLRQSDSQAFIEALRTVRQRYPFSLYAYVLMSNGLNSWVGPTQLLDLAMLSIEKVIV